MTGNVLRFVAGVGIYLANEVNGIVISRCTIEDNFEPGVGIVVVQGENVVIENCGIEGNAGPAILVSSITGAPHDICREFASHQCS